METDAISLLKSVLNAQRIEVRSIDASGESIKRFDNGIREQLFVDYDYGIIAEQIEKNCKEHIIYVVTDPFGVYYIVFKQAKENPDESYILIGPYINRNDLPDPKEVAVKIGVDLFHVQTLQNYYYEIPAIENIEQIVFVFVQNAWPGQHFQIERTGMLLKENYGGVQVRLDSEEQLSMTRIEERYKIEDALIEAVGQGNTTEAYFYLAKFGDYKLQPRSGDMMRDNQNIILTLNTLFRKEVHHRKVHPAHVDEMSTAFAKRIVNCRNVYELNKVVLEMIRKYSLLVQNYSLQGYSELIEKVINYIDFHLAESLGLQILADQLNVNPSYLSRTFKKETGKTLTDYINEKRIEKSLFFLALTNLPVQEVAARVGILDENYFSRMFKKIKDMTPREYRNMVTGDDAKSQRDQ